MGAPKLWDMLSPIHEADPGMHVLIREWSKDGPCLWEGPVSDVPFIPFDGCTVARIEARIEEDMAEVQYYSVEVVELRGEGIPGDGYWGAMALTVCATADALADKFAKGRAGVLRDMAVLASRKYGEVDGMGGE